MDDAQNWLVSLINEGAIVTGKSKPSLDNVQAFLDALGRPDKSFRYRVIVGGTAGKGTVCRLTEDVLVRSGKTVTTLISPHIQSITERIRHNAQLISSHDFTDAILKIKEISQTLKIKPTYYEAIVLAGIFSGAKKGSEILICEVGLGGEFDAVNAVQGERISALTFIGNDHIEILGPTLADIAKTKAGIFNKFCTYGLTYEQIYYPEIQKTAKTEVNIIKGIKKKLNKKLARKIVEKICKKNHVDFQKLNLPARWEKVDKKTILDGSHSMPRFEFLESNLAKVNTPIIMVAGMAKNHDLKSFTPIMKYIHDVIWTKSYSSRHFHPTSQLQSHYKIGTTIDDPIEAFKHAQELQKQNPDHTILVTGSFYLCGDIRSLYYPAEQILIQQTEFPK